MLLLPALIFLGAMILVVKSADLALHYSSQIAKSLRIGSHVVGFLLIAGVSILPETFIAVVSASQGVPSFGLGTLWGSNVADLTIVFTIVAFFSLHEIKVKSDVLNAAGFYLLILSLPLLLGLDGYFSRIEGAALIVFGVFFYSWVLKKAKREATIVTTKFSFQNFFLFLFSMGLLLLGAQLTVTYGVELAEAIHVNPVLIGILIVALGTTLPELFFSIRAVQHNHDSLALGDILGTVMSDATIVVGIVALIQPFAFDQHLVRVTGVFMLLAAAFLFYLMKSGKSLTKKEGLLLFLFYIGYVLTEYVMNVSYANP